MDLPSLCYLAPKVPACDRKHTSFRSTFIVHYTGYETPFCLCRERFRRELVYGVLCHMIEQVTPSSKCVGDLALYLVTRGLKAADVIDPAKKGQVDFPDSVVALLEGRLGFPHTGFPQEVRRSVTRGDRGGERLFEGDKVVRCVSDLACCWWEVGDGVSD